MAAFVLPPGVKMTPMFEQYARIKSENENALLMFRMGDFYELFFDDAVIAAKALQITLTSRNPDAEVPVPMCGVPHHSVEAYIRQLIDKGFYVAVCDQIEDPKTAKGSVVERAVLDVRTPSTAIEDSATAGTEHCYLGAVWWDKDKEAGGFAWLDYSTGEWSGLHARKEIELWQWVLKLNPRELLVPDVSREAFQINKAVEQGEIFTVRVPFRGFFELKAAAERVQKAQKVQELGALGLGGKDELVMACGAILSYLRQTKKRDPGHLSPFVPLDLNRHLVIDEVTERNLEIFRRLDGRKGLGTLRHVLDETMTAMGARLLEERLRHPWKDLEQIRATADVVEFFAENPYKREALRQALDEVHDIERLSTRIETGKANPRDFVALKHSFKALEKARASFKVCEPGIYPGQEESPEIALPGAASRIYQNWDDLSDLSDMLEKSFVESPPVTMTDGGMFKPGFHPELDELIELAEHGSERLDALLDEEKRRNSLPRLKIGYNRVFGYYFELPKGMAAQAPPNFIRRQTVANAERYTSPELNELQDKITVAQDRRKALEYQLYKEIGGLVCNELVRIKFMSHALAALDFWQGLAEAAAKRNWARPALNAGADILIREGRHPVIEHLVGSAGFIANDLILDANRRLLLITGPNMAGKSTVLRQAALIVILAQMGSFVPASEAVIGLCDRVYSRVGASDNLAEHQSTFMVEMMETARILRQATKKSLVILDEIGRGTSTFDGLSLAWAVAENLAERKDGGIRTLFATHYHELTSLEGRIPGICNMNISVIESKGEIVFMHRLVPGPADRSYGIEVARLAGVPQPVVNRAKKILAALEKSRGAASNSDAAKAVRQLLPGLSPDAVSREAERPVLPDEKKPVDHPVLTALKDIDTDHLTPMKALALLTEWKQLWGEKNQ